MGAKENKKRDIKSFIITLIIFIISLIFAIVFNGFWKVLFIIFAAISGLFILIFLFGMLHLRSTKKPTKYVSSSSSSSPKYVKDWDPDTYQPPVENKKPTVQLTKDEQRAWAAYQKAQEGGYKNYQKWKTPAEWKINIWDKLNYYEKKGYVDVVKSQMKYEDKKNWEEAHPILTGTKKIINHIVSLDWVPTPGVSSGTTIKKKDSPEQAARDIKRILNYSGTYGDGQNGTCHYTIHEVSVNKYNEIYVRVETSSISLGEYGNASILRSNLRNEIYDATYSESGGFSLRVDVY